MDAVKWINDNKEWIFSGAGVVFITAIYYVIFKRKKSGSSQKIRTGDNSINIQAGRDIEIRRESKNNNVEEK
jgi:hypothetical protein